MLDRVMQALVELALEPEWEPRSNGIAETFVKTFKRDYVRLSARPDAAALLAELDRWFEDYKHASQHPSVYVIEEKRFC
jgi:putative transposase